MNTPRSGSSSPASVEVGLEARAPGGRTRCGRRTRSTSPRCSRSRTIIPAHVPKHRPLEPADRLVEPVEAHQPHERRRLAARDHEPVEPLELLRLAHLDDVRAEPAQHRRVLAEVALHGEDADPHGTCRPLPAASFEQLFAGASAAVGDADHRLAEPGGDAREHLGVLEVRRRLDDRLRARRRDRPRT